MAKYDKKGREVPDPTPVEMPVGYKVPETLQEMIARMVQMESVRAGKQGRETFEEADDFDTGEGEMELSSPHQMTEMEEETPRFSVAEERRIQAEAVERFKAEQKGKAEAYIEEKNSAVGKKAVTAGETVADT